ncbi:MAG: S8 family serine peptidase [Bacteroidales bacterium]|jgi:hypothetical protein
MANPKIYSHLFFKNIVEGVKIYKQPQRYIPPIEESEKDYNPMQTTFKSCLNKFTKKQNERYHKRDIKLNIPIHIDYIEITFFEYFTPDLENKYLLYYGLSPVKYELYNEKVLFAISDTQKFEVFKKEILNFTNTENPNIKTELFKNIIKYIKEFEFLTSEKILTINEKKELTYLNLVDNPDIFQSHIKPIEDNLILFLKQKNISYKYDKFSNSLEVVNTDIETIKFIADNFDIIHKVNSFKAGIIKPSTYNLPGRSIGYEIKIKKEIPIIGIIDTGISPVSSLKQLIINKDNQFDLTGTSALEDNTDHGTSVANLAVLGSAFYLSEEKIFHADAKVLSIKVLDNKHGNISYFEIVRLIKKAYEEHNVKIFVLTICNEKHKKDNEAISEYAYLIDRLTYELDILIFISTGNINDLTEFNNNRSTIVKYPSHFINETANICVPSESMNNITIGAIADNFENNKLNGITPAKELPAIYTRKFNLNYDADMLTSTQKNNKLFKPDVVHYGGDCDDNLYVDKEPALTVLSSKSNLSFVKNIGTSYSAPLVANIAAKILYKYPKLNMQTIKALIINSAQRPWGSFVKPDVFKSLSDNTLRHLIGNGLPDTFKCLNSTDNEVTLILEDEIQPETIKAYSLKIPDYLNKIITKRSILEVSATLSFKFLPVKNSHLTYCPIHITFGFFRNLPLDSINGSKLAETKFCTSWAEDYYFKGKLLSNTQKISFSITPNSLINENNQIKIAINSKFHKLLNSIQLSEYKNKTNKFSMIINIKEKPINNILSGRLYNELSAINTVEVIGTIEQEIELENSI